MSRTAGPATAAPTLRVSTGPGETGAEWAVRAARQASDVAVRRTGPSGAAADPLVAATADGRTAYFASPDETLVREVAAALADGELLADRADAVADHDPEAATFPPPARGPLSVGRRDVLGPCGWVDPLDPAHHEFVASDPPPEALADLGLLGRGRGDAALDEPVADVWATARATDGDPVVVVNANDASDLPSPDDTLLAGAPLAVLDGAALVAAHVGATDLVVYCNETERALHDHLREAVAAADALPVDVQVVAGPDAYRAGGPTAALEALEGADRIEPRRQPPTPAAHGLYGRPTVVHTPRTVAQVRHAVRAGVDTEAADPGTRLLAVAGDVAAPATVELGSAASLDRVRDAVDLSGTYKMACVGGVFGGLVRDLDVAPTARSLRAAGLGTDGTVELLDESRCAVATVGERARFAATENSGRCVPGREGTKQLTELLRDVYDGSLETDKIRELGRVMRRSSNCRLGAHAPRPAVSALDEFEPEFRAHAKGDCPSGACRGKL